jgi:segregation and condensation protein B
MDTAQDTAQPKDSAILPNIIEAILFVANGAVTLDALRKTLDAEPEAIQQALAVLAERRADSGVRLQRKGSEVQLATTPEAAPFIEKFLGISVSGRLSTAALETLAIIAYREPITRVQIEAIRGVNSDGVIGTLLARGMIAETGRLETVGHPIQYSTTFQFLQQFGLKSTDDLPPLEEKTTDAQAVEVAGDAA